MAGRRAGPRFGFALLAALALLLRPGVPARAAQPPCEPAPAVAAGTAAPADGRAADLAPPFRLEPTRLDRAGLLAETQRRVAAQLRAIEAPGCYAALLPDIAARTALLSPFEFLVVGYYRQDREARDRLLRLYREDPRQAVRSIASIWPSPRAERLVGTPAVFDLDDNQVYVNLGAVAPERAPNVLAHEFWHALANVRPGRTADGAASRTTGFWTQARPPGGLAWVPVEEEVAGGVPTYLMNEAVAIEMEAEATGREHGGLRPDLLAAGDLLQRLFAAAGRPRVLRLYLESRSEELREIARQAALAAGD